jgi:hypothetical protein
MQLSKSVLIITTIISLTFGLGGCASSLIGVREGAERVSLANANRVAACQSKGSDRQRAYRRWLYQSQEDVEANLYQLGTKCCRWRYPREGESTAFGKRTFEMFKCRPK